jgi:hypothetical protein
VNSCRAAAVNKSRMKLSMKSSAKAGSVHFYVDRAPHDIAMERQCRPAPGQNPVIPPPTSQVAFCVWPICLVTRPIGLAGTQQPFGARPATYYLLLMP